MEPDFDRIRRVETRKWIRFGICPTKDRVVIDLETPLDKKYESVSIISRTIMNFPRMFSANLGKP